VTQPRSMQLWRPQRPWGSPESYGEIFEPSGKPGILSLTTANSIGRLIRLRDLLVYRYWEVNDEGVYREARGLGA